MKKRLNFKCWNCTRKYSLYREITIEQKIIVACPFCNEEAVVQLQPFKKEIISVFKGENAEEQTLGYEYDFPEIIPTHKPE